MTRLILSIADWLTLPQTLVMPGWMWLASIPLAILLLAVLFCGLLWAAFVCSFRPW